MFVKARLASVPVLSILLLLLAIGVSVLWVRSRRHADVFVLFSPAGHWQGVAADRGGILICTSNVPKGREYAWTADAASLAADDFLSVHEFLFDPSRSKWHLLGFRFASGKVDPTGSGNQWIYDALVVPYWVLLFVLAPLPLAMCRRGWVRWRRKRRGVCLHCGYDTRASTGRCPECGTPVIVKGQAAPAAEAAVTPNLLPVFWNQIAWRALPLLALLLAVGAVAVLLARGRRMPASEQLDLRIVDFAIDGQPLQSSVASLGRSIQVRIDVDPRDLKAWDDNPPAPDARLHDIKLAGALEVLFSGQAVQFWSESGVVKVAASEHVPRVLRVYPVGDILRSMTYAAGRPRNTILGSGACDADLVVPTDTLLFEYTVWPDSWNNDGGSRGAIRSLGCRLIVCETPEGQSSVQRFLDAFRSTAATAWMQSGNKQPSSDRVDLDMPISELQLEDGTFKEAIDKIGKQTHANIAVDWHELSRWGIGANTRVRLHLWDTTLNRALSVLLSAAGGRDVGVAYTALGVVLVGSGDRGDDPAVEIRLYDIRDLIEDELAYEKAHGSGPWSGRTRTVPSNTLLPSTQRTEVSAEDAIDNITYVIEATAATESWKENGGSIGSMREFGGRLIVTQTAENHRAVAAVLRALRAGGSKDGLRIPPQAEKHHP